MKVWKFPLDRNFDRTSLEIPSGAKFLHVGMQVGTIVLWFLVDPERTIERRSFIVKGTGWEIPHDLANNYLGTALENGGSLVWHVFEEKE